MGNLPACLHSGKHIHLSSCCTTPLMSIVNSVSSECQSRMKTTSSSENFQAFSSELEVLKHPTWETKKLLNSQSLLCEIAIVELLLSYYVSHNEFAFNVYSFYLFCISEEFRFIIFPREKLRRNYDSFVIYMVTISLWRERLEFYPFDY